MLKFGLRVAVAVVNQGLERTYIIQSCESTQLDVANSRGIIISGNYFGLVQGTSQIYLLPLTITAVNLLD